MNSKRPLLFIALAVSAILTLSSCSGLKTPCTTNCGGGGTGNAALSLTISDTPPTNTTVVSFSLPIIGITLTPSSGSPVSVFSPSSSTAFELTRLQSDTNLIASKVSVAAGSYTAVSVTVSAPSGVFINSSTSTVGSCVAGAVCSLTGSAATITYTFPSGSPLVLTANANQWLDLDFAYNNAIVTTSGIGIDVTQSGVLTASSTVPTGIPSGSFANIDDFTGVVQTISSTSITLQSSVRGSITASLSSSIPVYDPQGQCTGGGSLSCISAGSIVSLQGLLSTAGVVSATSLDVIDASTTPADEVEGIIYPSSCNGGSNYGLILSDSDIFTSGSPLTSAGFGSGVCLTLAASPSFFIDTGILTGQSGVPTGVGFSSSSDILGGQTVRVKVTNAATGSVGINATATALILRYSRFTASVNTVSGYTFSLTSVPAYFPTFTVSPLAQTYPSATILEGVSSTSSLATGNTVSVSALFLNPSSGITYPFQVQKVRLQPTN